MEILWSEVNNIDNFSHTLIVYTFLLALSCQLCWIISWLVILVLKLFAINAFTMDLFVGDVIVLVSYKTGLCVVFYICLCFLQFLFVRFVHTVKWKWLFYRLNYGDLLKLILYFCLCLIAKATPNSAPKVGSTPNFCCAWKLCTNGRLWTKALSQSFVLHQCLVLHLSLIQHQISTLKEGYLPKLHTKTDRNSFISPT